MTASIFYFIGFNLKLTHVMRKKNLFMPYANNKDADQPAHPRSLISAFVVRCLDSIIPVVYISEIASLYLDPVAEQAGLSLTWSKTPKTGFLVRGALMISQRCIKQFPKFTLTSQNQKDIS